MDKERQKLLKTFLDLYFFKEWKEDIVVKRKKTGISLVISSVCNTKCSYCYYKNYGNELYPYKIQNPENIVKNTEIFLDWLFLNGYKLNYLEIFSGEFFNLSFYREILDICKKYFKRSNIKGSISVPSNSTFLFSESKTKEVSEIIEEFSKEGVDILISHSVDGKYLDNFTRKTKSGEKYDDKFYENLFRFAKKYDFCFHPMVSAEGISEWKENFVWYINKLIDSHGSFDEAIRYLYLLEVRNPDWKKEDLVKLEDFILFMIEYLFQKVGRDKTKFIRTFLMDTRLNFFTSIFSLTGRGIGCSTQTELEVRMGDLAIIPCHRTSYNGFSGGYFKVENDKIVDIIPENPETYILFKSFQASESIGCGTCLIGDICSHYCMGTNMEVNKDFFIPVETVCRMEFVKVISIVKGLMGIGVLDMALRLIGNNGVSEFNKKVAQILYIKEIIEKGEESEFFRG